MTALDIVKAFESRFGAQPDFVVRSPGRVDIIGTHTDYNGGWVLPAAIDHYAWLAVSRQDDRALTIQALDMEAEVSFSLNALEGHKADDGSDLPHWAAYAGGVAWSLQKAGLSTPGARIVLSSNVPVGAGLSSSAAVEVAYAMAWKQLAGWTADRMTLARLCQRAENQYVGVNSGLMDQFACLHGLAGNALLFDCRTLDWEALPLPSDVLLVVADTGSRRSLTSSHYNERRADCEAAVEILKGCLPGVVSLRDVTVDQFEEFKTNIPEQPRMRAAHVVYENERVLAAARALRAADRVKLGNLMDESQISSRDLFDASGPELNAMWKAAHGHPARLGGRFAGGGWAGCMVFLVRADGCDDFSAYLSTAYQQATGIEPKLYHMQTADGAQVMSPEQAA